MALRGTSGSKIGRHGMTRSERSKAMREASYKASDTVAGRTVQEVARRIRTGEPGMGTVGRDAGRAGAVG